MTQRTYQRGYEGKFEACAHYIKFSYWWDGWPNLTDELAERLLDEAERRVRELLAADYHSGELAYHHHDHATGKEDTLFGWWEIARD
jgi:hypothetical protein